MSSRHTPTPWRFGHAADAIVAGDTKGNAPDVDYYGGTLVAESLNHADRDFVVRACNAHEQLVAALRGIAELMLECSAPQALKREAVACIVAAEAALTAAGAQ